MNDDFSQRVLDRIEQEHVHPLPRWMVVARRVLMGALIVVSFIVASVFGSLVIVALLQIDPAFIRASSFGPMLRLLREYIPAVWVVLFVLLCLGEIILIRRKTVGYRHSLLVVGGVVVLGVCLLGLGLYATRVPERVEMSIERRVPLPIRPWVMRGAPRPRPEDGVLFGRILVVATSTFSVEGPRRDIWQVVPERSEQLSLPFLAPNGFVLIQGKMERPGLFMARTIQPHRGPPPPREKQFK